MLNYSQMEDVMDTKEPNPDLTVQEQHIIDLETEARRGDLGAIRTLTHLMDNGESDKIRLAASTAWLEHRRETQEALLRLQALLNPATRETRLIIEEKSENAQQIRDEILGKHISAVVSTKGE